MRQGKTVRTAITHTLAGAAALGLIATTATAAPAATRDGGGIFWAAPTCELAMHNDSDSEVEIWVQTDENLHSGVLLRDDQEPLAQYDGAHEKSMLLQRVAAMADPPDTLTRIPAGRTASFATGCTAEQMQDLGPFVLVMDGETGEHLRSWRNTYWPGHIHDSTGNVLLTFRG